MAHVENLVVVSRTANVFEGSQTIDAWDRE